MARAASYVVSGTLDFPNRLLRFPVETQRRGSDPTDVKPVSPRYFFTPCVRKRISILCKEQSSMQRIRRNETGRFIVYR